MIASLRRLSVALWLGLVATLGAVVAPTLFAALERVQAGALAGQMFRIEAQVGLMLGALWLVLDRREAARRDVDEGSAPKTNPSVDMQLVLGALFCTVLGFFALQPMMAAAKAGTGDWSFGQLHAVSSVFFALKGLCLLALVARSR